MPVIIELHEAVRIISCSLSGATHRTSPSESNSAPHMWTEPEPNHSTHVDDHFAALAGSDLGENLQDEGLGHVPGQIPHVPTDRGRDGRLCQTGSSMQTKASYRASSPQQSPTVPKAVLMGRPPLLDTGAVRFRRLAVLG